jgi:NAD(P)-dependent dehydrogenase (short-subunit alcohol dehydrogenase family)
MEDLQGRVAIVTGGASGIGLAMAQRFAAEGMNVVLGDIEQGALDAAVASLRDSGASAVGALVDVSDPVQMTTLADAARDEFGGFHVVCLNAGVGGGGLSWEADLATWKWVLDVNLWGIINGLHAFVPELVEQKVGHVVITASLAGFVYGPGMGPYNASKAAAVAIGETLAAELAAEAPEVGVSILCPGWVNTRIFESDRNRPGGAVERDPAAQQMRKEMAAFFAASMPATDVAEAVLAAVKERRLHILTHEMSEPALRDRIERVLGGT